MRTPIFISVLVLLAASLAACTSTATPAPSTSSRPVDIEISTNPSPAVMGDIELVLTVTDANGDRIEGATVDVSANHIDMTGMTMSGLATDQGDGIYAITAGFSMSGNWKLTVYVRKDTLDYKEDIDFKVQ